MDIWNRIQQLTIVDHGHYGIDHGRGVWVDWFKFEDAHNIGLAYMHIDWEDQPEHVVALCIRPPCWDAPSATATHRDLVTGLVFAVGVLAGHVAPGRSAEPVVPLQKATAIWNQYFVPYWVNQGLTPMVTASHLRLLPPRVTAALIAQVQVQGAGPVIASSL